MSIDLALGEINARLKAAKIRCRIERRGSSLVLRASLPDRESATITPRQQRIPLNLDASYASLGDAEAAAHRLGHELRRGTFDWDSWVSPETRSLTVADFRSAAARMHASRYRLRPEVGARVWNKQWAPALSRLPASGAISEASLMRLIKSLPAQSAGRRDKGGILSLVWAALGGDPVPLRKAANGYGARSLAARHLPEDDDIEAAWAQINATSCWGWTVGMCAAFGLRPSETVEATLSSNEGVCQVGEATKTGSRLVFACHKEWVHKFNLFDKPVSKKDPNNANDQLASAKMPWRLYDLRHAYAIRLNLKGVPPVLAAQLMGHSLKVHCETYQKWIAAKTVTAAMKQYDL